MIRLPHHATIGAPMWPKQRPGPQGSGRCVLGGTVREGSDGEPTCFPSPSSRRVSPTVMPRWKGTLRPVIRRPQGPPPPALPANGSAWRDPAGVECVGGVALFHRGGSHIGRHGRANPAIVRRHARSVLHGHTKVLIRFEPPQGLAAHAVLRAVPRRSATFRSWSTTRRSRKKAGGALRTPERRDELVYFPR